MTSNSPWVARWLAFPVILLGGLGVTMSLMASGSHPARAALTGEGVAVVAIAIAERLWPFVPKWNRSHGDLRTDTIHLLVSGLSAQEAIKPLLSVAGAVAAGWLSSVVGASLWPTSWPWVPQLALALAVAEFFQYWIHRWQHEHDLLWRFHAIHHSAPRLYWLNAARFHPADLVLLLAVGYLPLVILGCPLEVLVLFGAFDAIFGLLQHCNIDYRLGPFDRLFSAATPHRWHHSRVLREANTNYGSNLIVWDLVFGTFFLPRDRRPPSEIGIADLPRFPMSYGPQLTAPFRWRAFQREAGPRAA